MGVVTDCPAGGGVSIMDQVRQRHNYQVEQMQATTGGGTFGGGPF